LTEVVQINLGILKISAIKKWPQFWATV